MKVWTTLTDDDLYDIATEIGVRISAQGSVYNGRPAIGRDGRARRFNLRPTDERNENGDRPYQRVSASAFRPERRVYAVCWHGYRDFMREIFSRDPEARIKTYVADYKGKEDFEEKYPETAYTNVGSMMYPQYLSEVCKC